MYDEIIRYLQIEYLLANELFHKDETQFGNILNQALSSVSPSFLLPNAQYLGNLRDSFEDIEKALNLEITSDVNVTSHISKLCSLAHSCAIFIQFLQQGEPSYQKLLQVPKEPVCTAETRQSGHSVPMESGNGEDSDLLQRPHEPYRHAHALRPLSCQRPGHHQHADLHGSRRSAVIHLDRELSAVD